MSTQPGTGRSIVATYSGLRRNFNTIYIVWYRDVLRYIRDRTRIITSLVQPLMFLFIVGSGLRNSLSETSRGIMSSGSALDFRTFLFPGVLSMAVLFTAIFSAISIVW